MTCCGISLWGSAPSRGVENSSSFPCWSDILLVNEWFQVNVSCTYTCASPALRHYHTNRGYGSLYHCVQEVPITWISLRVPTNGMNFEEVASSTHSSMFIVGLLHRTRAIRIVSGSRITSLWCKRSPFDWRQYSCINTHPRQAKSTHFISEDARSRCAWVQT